MMQVLTRGLRFESIAFLLKILETLFCVCYYLPFNANIWIIIHLRINWKFLLNLAIKI